MSVTLRRLGGQEFLRLPGTSLALGTIAFMVDPSQLTTGTVRRQLGRQRRVGRATSASTRRHGFQVLYQIVRRPRFGGNLWNSHDDRLGHNLDADAESYILGLGATRRDSPPGARVFTFLDCFVLVSAPAGLMAVNSNDGALRIGENTTGPLNLRRNSGSSGSGRFPMQVS